MDRSVIRYVKEMQAGNEQAFTELYHAIYDDVFRMAYSHVHNQADANDVTQEVFISLYNNINNLQDPEAFPLWVQKVVFTRCTRLFRKRKDSLMSENDELTLSYETEKELDFLPKEKFDNESEQELIHELVEKLQPKHQEVINCVYFNQMSVQEASLYLNRPKGTIKSQLYSARKELSAYITEYERKNARKIKFYDMGSAGFMSLAPFYALYNKIKSSANLWKISIGISTATAAVACVASGITIYQMNQPHIADDKQEIQINQKEKAEGVTALGQWITTPQDAYFALVDWGVTPDIAKTKPQSEIDEMRKLVHLLSENNGIYWNRFINEGWNTVFEVK